MGSPSDDRRVGSRRLMKIVRAIAQAYLVVFCGFAAFFATYLALHRDRIFPNPKVAVVYGRDRCGFTAAMKEYLAKERIPFVYGNIDGGFLLDQEMWHALHGNTAPDTDPNYASLPVVRIGGRVLERPEPSTVSDIYREVVADPSEAVE
jgi:hypothetical protein